MTNFRSVIALTCTALSACTTVLSIPPEDAFTPAPKAEVANVTLIVATDPTAECARIFPFKRIAGNLSGCAGWNADFTVCTIVIGEVTTHQVLGHELRHCFEGNYHS